MKFHDLDKHDRFQIARLSTYLERQSSGGLSGDGTAELEGIKAYLRGEKLGAVVTQLEDLEQRRVSGKSFETLRLSDEDEAFEQVLAGKDVKLNRGRK